MEQAPLDFESSASTNFTTPASLLIFRRTNIQNLTILVKKEGAELELYPFSKFALVERERYPTWHNIFYSLDIFH
jgi:hypothetical protein